ncbi:MAG TPA: EpsI family protein [Sphingomicrobium sp.]|nr:EpsI family protein [Sphingomicrobium sp.]
MNATIAPPERLVLSRRQILTGLVMGAAAAVAAVRKPDIRLDYLGPHKLEDIVPKRIGRWDFVTTSGLVIPPSDQLQLALYSQLLTRVYSDGTNAIQLLIAYSASETGFLQVHRPEFCYTAAGYRLSDFSLHTVQGTPRAFTANTMTATRDSSTEKLLYWVRIGEHIPHSWAEQKLTFAEDNLRRLIPDAALIRVSTVGLDDAQALPMIDQFVREMIGSIPGPLRRVLVA